MWGERALKEVFGLHFRGNAEIQYWFAWRLSGSLNPLEQ